MFILLIMWLGVQYSIGLYFFTTGFFLTRIEVDNRNHCNEPLQGFRIPATHLRQEVTKSFETEETCWMKPRYKRIVWVIIDALRYDFVLFNPEFRNTSKDAAEKKFYTNHLPIVQTLLENEPQHSLLYKFQADPPTMTMQRLKGLTTGGLPTFLDIKDNMHSSEITEDSIIHQMTQQNRDIIFMGDDTWNGLYAPHFKRNYSYDSFNVKDLHTVDNGVIEHLFPELKTDDWDMIIAHFLGVDHVGHIFGPEDIHMEQKLEQMNQVLEKLFGQVEEDTLVAVLGDHGMTNDGNHGGATDEETGAALFLYSKTPLVKKAEALKSLLQTDNRIVSQVDFVPTISLLLGLPIPFGSLGSIIPELFFHSAEENMSTDDSDLSTLESLRKVNTALELNVHQVRQYFSAYANIARIAISEESKLEDLYAKAESLAVQSQRLEESGNNFQERIDKEVQRLKLMQSYLHEALSAGRDMWTQFNLVQMIAGIWILFNGLIIHVLVVADSRMRFDLKYLLGGLIGACLMDLILFPLNIAISFDLKLRMLFLSIMGTQMGFLVSILFEENATLSPSNMKFSIFSCGCWVVVAIHALSLTSNSYIVAEHLTYQFLSTTTGILLFVTAVARQFKHKIECMVLSIVFTMVGRVATLFDPPNVIYTDVTMIRTLIPLAIFGLLDIVYGCIVTKIGLTTLSVSISLVYAMCFGCWVSEIVWLPQSVYGSSVAGIASLIFYRGASKQLRRQYIRLFLLLSAPFLIVLGPTAPITWMLFVVQAFSFIRLVYLLFDDFGMEVSIVWVTLIAHYFYATGHHNDFAALQNAAGLVGFEDFSFYRAGILLAYNTYGTYFIGILAAPGVIALLWPCKSTLQDVVVGRFLLSVFAIIAINSVVSTVFVGVQRRHLMVWAIFAPKFIYDGCILIVSSFTTILSWVIYCTLRN